MSDVSAPVVIDSGVAIALAVEADSLHRHALQLFEHLDAGEVQLVAPVLFDYEVAAVLRLWVFRHTISAKNAIRFDESDLEVAHKIIESLEIELIHDPEVIEESTQIARDFGQARTYDSSYAALAKLRGFAFWTADHNFYISVNGPDVPATKRLPFVHYLGSLPIDSARD